MAERPPPQHCRSCLALVYWTITEAKGNFMPVDAEPSETGTLRLYRHKVGGDVISAVVPAEARVVGEEYFTSHFATCVNAAKHRKKRASG